MDEPEIRIDFNTVEWERVDQAALALMLLGVHDGWRSWKGFDWGVLNRLHERGFITDPRSKAKSVVFTVEGIEESQRLFETLFLRGSK
jgi:Domain of unknown function (DUF6429)